MNGESTVNYEMTNEEMFIWNCFEYYLSSFCRLNGKWKLIMFKFVGLSNEEQSLVGL